MSPERETMPTPILFALPSIPSVKPPRLAAFPFATTGGIAPEGWAPRAAARQLAAPRTTPAAASAPAGLRQL
jgi:hypothetical protein